MGVVRKKDNTTQKSITLLVCGDVKSMERLLFGDVVSIERLTSHLRCKSTADSSSDSSDSCVRTSILRHEHVSNKQRVKKHE